MPWTFEDGYTEGTFLWVVSRTYFQYFSVLITIVSAIVAIGVSLATSEPDYTRIGGLTYGTVSDAHTAEIRRSWDWRDALGSAVVLAAILGAYLYFRGGGPAWAPRVGSPRNSGGRPCSTSAPHAPAPGIGGTPSRTLTSTGRCGFAGSLSVGLFHAR